ncbi:MAG: hypothetical protein VX463_07325 [Pseudomonadota bacterium]|nr:hypothetical protein [Pseudomonadota bacterium]
MIDFAADLGRIHADVLGVDAVYAPTDGAAFAVRVSPARADSDVHGSFATPAWSETTTVQIATSVVTAGAGRDPAKGDGLTVDGVSYTIKSFRRHDVRRLAWLLDLQPA